MTGFMMEFIFTIFGRLDNVLLNDRTCIQANTIEGHVWLSVILLVAENLRRTRDSSLNYSTPLWKDQRGDFWRDFAHFHDHRFVLFQFLRHTSLSVVSARVLGQHLAGASLRRVFHPAQSRLVEGPREGGQSGALRRWSGIPGRPRPVIGRSSTSWRALRGSVPQGWGWRPLRWTRLPAPQSPCAGKVSPHPHTHPQTKSARHARARVTHVTHVLPAHVSVALCSVSACE